MEHLLPTFAILIVLIFLMGLFVLAEMSIATSRRSRLLMRAEEGDRGARVALDLQENPNKFLGIVQIGITLLTTFIAAWAAPRFEHPVMEAVAPWLGDRGDTVAFVLVVSALTFLELVLAELVPKRLALQAPEALASFLSRPMTFLALLARPVIWLLSFSTEFVLWILRRRTTAEEQITTEDIRQMVREGAEDGTVQDHEERIIESVFRLGERRIRQVRTPRADVVGLDLSHPWREQLDSIMESGYSRLPVYEETLDQVTGILVVKDLLKIPLDGDVRTLLRQPMYVHEGASAVEVLKRLQKERTHLALVIDEHGAFEGVVSMEDLLEEIVGEIEDEYDQDVPDLVENGKDEWSVEGSMAPDRLREVLGLREPFAGESEGHFDTIAGFVLEQLGRIPAVGDCLVWDDFEIEVVTMDVLRIATLRIHRVASE